MANARGKTEKRTARTARSRRKAGERRRDEARAGGPRMEGRQWHDFTAPRDMSSEAPIDTMPDVEVPPEPEGMKRAPSQRRRHGGSRK